MAKLIKLSDAGASPKQMQTIVITIVSVLCLCGLICFLDLANIYHLEFRSTRQLYRDCLRAEMPPDASDISRQWLAHSIMLTEFKLPPKNFREYMAHLPEGFGPSQEGYPDLKNDELRRLVPAIGVLVANKETKDEDWTAVADPDTGRVWMVCIDH